MSTVKVEARKAVLGLQRGEVGEVENSKQVRGLIRNGTLREVRDPDPQPEGPRPSAASSAPASAAKPTGGETSRGSGSSSAKS